MPETRDELIIRGARALMAADVASNPYAAPLTDQVWADMLERGLPRHLTEPVEILVDSGFVLNIMAGAMDAAAAMIRSEAAQAAAKQAAVSRPDGSASTGDGWVQAGAWAAGHIDQFAANVRKAMTDV